LKIVSIPIVVRGIFLFFLRFILCVQASRHQLTRLLQWLLRASGKDPLILHRWLANSELAGGMREDCRRHAQAVRAAALPRFVRSKDLFDFAPEPRLSRE
jgi:hypothetical protein